MLLQVSATAVGHPQGAAGHVMHQQFNIQQLNTLSTLN
jgi:hypothetical protein